MSKKSTPVLRIVTGVAFVSVIGYFVADSFDLGTRWKIHRAISQLEDGVGTADAHKALQKIEKRMMVIEALKGALEDEGKVAGKLAILNSLGSFGERRAVNRSAESKVVSTRRASVMVRYDLAKNDPSTPDILLDWLQDESADARGRAALMLARFKIKEAEPHLIKIISKAPTSPADIAAVRGSLNALRQFKTKGLAPHLIKLFSNKSLDVSVRAEALETLSFVDDSKRELVLDHALKVIADKDNERILRMKMTSILRRPSWGSPKVWDVLEKILLDESEPDHTTQRTCLEALSKSAPLERVKNLFLNKTVYRHPYFGIRVDVAVGLATLNVREAASIDILGLLLEDDDPKDTQHLVRSEAFLSLWVLTGVANGVREKELFRRPPMPIRDEEQKREYLLRAAFLRPGINDAQVRAVRNAVKDRAQAKKIRQLYTNPRAVQMIVESWAAQKKAADERAKELERKRAGNVDKDSGPMPPPTKDGDDKDGCGDGDAGCGEGGAKDLEKGPGKEPGREPGKGDEKDKDGA